jgi:hypothetical protein
MVWGTLWGVASAFFLGAIFGVWLTLITIVPMVLLVKRLVNYGDYMLESIDIPRKFRFAYMIASSIGMLVVILFALQVWRRGLGGLIG